MRKVLKNRTYLYLTEFFSGMAVMAVELGASRLLAPYFSSSQIVWTIIIATIMIAMALGNLYGGVRADKDPNPDRLYRRLLIASVWIALIPAAGKYVILGITGLLVITVSQNLLIIASFLACMVIFVFPCFLLGTCTPSLARYVTGEGGGEVGAVVGRLGAFNTIGSIIGTFVPTFVTIPAVGTAITFLIFAGILLLLALLYFFSGRGRRGGAIVSIVLFVLGGALGWRSHFAFWKDGLRYEGESVYNYLQVEETDESVVLSTNVLFGVQSILPKRSRFTGMYYDCAMAAPYMAGAAKKQERGVDFDLLVLGMGTGTYGSQCVACLPGVRVEGVEIDGKITALAREYFAMPEDLPVATYDGRAYLNAVDKRYDVIMVDAYQDITIPFQMASVEFFTLVRAHLKDGGVMVVNMNMRGTREGNINQYLADTISAVFPEVYTADVAHNTNRELFASCNPEMLAVLARNLEKIGDGELRGMLLRVSEGLTRYEPGSCVMTDDRAPVELLSMRVIDELIRDEVAWYREVYAQYGLRGVLGSL